MTINRSVLGIAALAGLFVIPVGVQAADQKPAQLEGLIRENILVPLPRLDNPPHKLDALLTCPAALGRYPLLVIRDRGQW